MVRNGNVKYQRLWNSTTSQVKAAKFVKLSFPNFDHSNLWPIPLVTLLLSTMPPKDKQKASGSTEKKPTPKPAPAKPAKDEVATTREGRLIKPDQAVYQAEQDALKKEIDEITAKLVCPRLFICQRKVCSHHTLNGRTLSRTRLMGLREAPGTNERMS